MVEAEGNSGKQLIAHTFIDLTSPEEKPVPTKKDDDTEMELAGSPKKPERGNAIYTHFLERIFEYFIGTEKNARKAESPRKELERKVTQLCGYK
jgi:hypothetical protein